MLNDYLGITAVVIEIRPDIAGHANAGGRLTVTADRLIGSRPSPRER